MKEGIFSTMWDFVIIEITKLITTNFADQKLVFFGKRRRPARKTGNLGFRVQDPGQGLDFGSKSVYGGHEVFGQKIPPSNGVMGGIFTGFSILKSRSEVKYVWPVRKSADHH